MAIRYHTHTGTRTRTHTHTHTVACAPATCLLRNGIIVSLMVGLLLSHTHTHTHTHTHAAVSAFVMGSLLTPVVELLCSCAWGSRLTSCCAGRLDTIRWGCMSIGVAHAGHGAWIRWDCDWRWTHVSKELWVGVLESFFASRGSRADLFRMCRRLSHVR
jgi:hypothetical protein